MTRTCTMITWKAEGHISSISESVYQVRGAHANIELGVSDAMCVECPLVLRAGSGSMSSGLLLLILGNTQVSTLTWESANVVSVTLGIRIATSRLFASPVVGFGASSF